MNDIFHEIGLMRREVRDARAIASNVDHKLTRLIEGAGASRRDGSLIARIAACRLISKSEGTAAAAVAAKNWPHDYELRAAVCARDDERRDLDGGIARRRNSGRHLDIVGTERFLAIARVERRQLRPG